VTIDACEAEVLLHARGDALDDLCQSAARVRDQGLADAGRSGVITYSRKVFIPLTRLCRDRCHYCTFATTPKRVKAAFLSPDEVLTIARQGAELGCKEALFTLGDRPEDRWPPAQEWLNAHGYDSTLAYVRAMAIMVLEKTGLLPHLNPGVMSWSELQQLKPVAPSMGMMLETTSRRLFENPNGAHFGSPDKDPALRIRVLEDAGRSTIPFTTGILVGIGETLAERIDSLFEVRRIARAFGSIQETIIQNFRAKPDTAMARMPDADVEDLAATVAVARLILGPRMRIQAPPNLIGDEYQLLLKAGIDDWGGVSPLTPDHVNPERPWPQIEELTALSAESGFEVVERLAVYPTYVTAGEPWLDPRVMVHVRALADADGLANADAQIIGRPWQEPDDTWSSTGRTQLHTTIDTEGRTSDRRDDFDTVYGDWGTVAEEAKRSARATPRLDADIAAALRAAERDPGNLSDADALAMFYAEGDELEAIAALADAIREDASGGAVTYVVNRNINFTNVCYTGCRFCAFAQRRTDADAYTLSMEEVADRAAEAWELGATEVCMQGGIHPDLPGTAYFDIARTVKQRVPGMHVHAFSPMEVINGASRTGLSIRDWLTAAKEAGLDSIPGTAAEILDDEVRWLLTKGKLPAREWIEVITTAHELGIRSSSTMMYGHVDKPSHWLGHLRTLARIQDQTGGFTEFVPLPFIHTNAPIYLAGVARPGPTVRENRVVHAMARILLYGRIDNIQCSWVKLGVEGSRQVLTGGVNDLGGTLMEETISRMAGSQHGSAKTVAQFEEITAPLPGRSTRQRLTDYGPVPAERRAAAHRFTGVLPSLSAPSA
jgi:FO synthase